MRASAQIRKRDAGRRKRVNCEIGGLFGLSTVGAHAEMMDGGGEIGEHGRHGAEGAQLHRRSGKNDDAG